MKRAIYCVLIALISCSKLTQAQASTLTIDLVKALVWTYKYGLQVQVANIAAQLAGSESKDRRGGVRLKDHRSARPLRDCLGTEALGQYATEAMKKAGRFRLRPIVVIALATIAGMLPLSLAIRAGS